MAAYRTLEITLISAKDLKDVNFFSRMDVYAVAAVAGDPRSKQRTAADKEGGRNPNWNSTLRFTVPVADPGRLVLHVLLRSERAFGDRDVGEVHIPVKELIDAAAAKKSSSSAEFVSYQVRKPNSGRAKGVLNLSYRFLDHAPAAAPPQPAAPKSGGQFPAAAAYPPPSSSKGGDEPVTAYPVAAGSSYPPPGGAAPYPPPYQGGYGYGAPPPHASGYGYGPPPPQPGYGYGAPPPPGGYGYPPPAGYGYPPQPGPYGYGAAPPPVKPAKKNKFGMGLGAGLLGGAIGGMMLGDMVSDAAAYDSGYDAGFGDGMDF